MTRTDEIRTDRLILRRWRAEDLEPFAALNADPRVAEFLPAPLTREESDAMAERIARHFERHGFGLWAVEVPGLAAFVGCVGLSVPRFEAEFTPCIEIAWRLGPAFWGKGFATEAATRVVEVGFDREQLDEIVSFTVPANVRSRRIMERIGMRLSGEFDHPMLPEGHRLRRHVLYRIGRSEYRSAAVPPGR